MDDRFLFCCLSQLCCLVTISKLDSGRDLKTSSVPILQYLLIVIYDPLLKDNENWSSDLSFPKTAKYFIFFFFCILECYIKFPHKNSINELVWLHHSAFFTGKECSTFPDFWEKFRESKHFPGKKHNNSKQWLLLSTLCLGISDKIFFMGSLNCFLPGCIVASK